MKFKLERHALRPEGVDSSVPCRLLAQGECEEAMRLALEGSPGLTSDALELNTNAGDRDNLVVKLPQLPDKIEVCVSTFDRCSGAVRNVETASLSIDASEPVDITLFDCVEAKFTCVPGGRSRRSTPSWST